MKQILSSRRAIVKFFDVSQKKKTMNKKSRCECWTSLISGNSSPSNPLVARGWRKAGSETWREMRTCRFQKVEKNHVRRGEKKVCR